MGRHTSRICPDVSQRAARLRKRSGRFGKRSKVTCELSASLANQCPVPPSWPGRSLDNPVTQFSFRWILSLNWLCQKWGQVHSTPKQLAGAVSKRAVGAGSSRPLLRGTARIGTSYNVQRVSRGTVGVRPVSNSLARKESCFPSRADAASGTNGLKLLSTGLALA